MPEETGRLFRLGRAGGELIGAFRLVGGDGFKEFFLFLHVDGRGAGVGHLILHLPPV
ncbi:hypothetical protein HYU91_00160 [Candidatus Collierbacteria bacterium]|nr:hypothetical protein [Candidatus Collierbacteria bacterium]